MASSQLKSEYPHFRDADVLITSPTGRQWKLHRQILCAGSQVFKDLLRQDTRTRPSKVDRQTGSFIEWRLQMFDHPQARGVDPNGTHYKEFVLYNTRRPQDMLPAWSATGLGGDIKFNQIYDNLFRCLYSLSPDFMRADDEDGANASMKDSLDLLTAASYLKAYPAVRLVVENHLRNFNELLWYHVESNPEAWASIGCRLQSFAIFRESIIHLAGRYHLKGDKGIDKQKLEGLEFGKDIFELVTLKGRQLKDYKLQVERRLNEFVPVRMTRTPKMEAGGMVVAGRQVYASDIYWWMGLHLIRQYITSAMLQNRHHRAADGGIAFYRTISISHSYLHKDSLDAFHQVFSMTQKSRVVFAHALSELKKDFSIVVEGLLLDRCQVKRGRDDSPRIYLTCTVTLDEEMPWVERVRASRPVHITDEDEDDADDLIEVDDGRGNANLPGSSADTICLRDQQVVPRPSQSADASMHGSNEASSSNIRPFAVDTTVHVSNEPSASTIRPFTINKIASSSAPSRRPISEVDIDHDSSALPSKRAKTTATSRKRPSFPSDLRLPNNDAFVIESAIRTGMISGKELQEVQARAQTAAAAGVPNLGGLLPNSSAKPRGGLNSLLSKAFAGGYGVAPPTVADNEDDLIEEGDEPLDGGDDEMDESDTQMNVFSGQCQDAATAAVEVALRAPTVRPDLAATREFIASGGTSRQLDGIPTEIGSSSTDQADRATASTATASSRQIEENPAKTGRPSANRDSRVSSSTHPTSAPADSRMKSTVHFQDLSQATQPTFVPKAAPSSSAAASQEITDVRAQQSTSANSTTNGLTVSSTAPVPPTHLRRPDAPMASPKDFTSACSINSSSSTNRAFQPAPESIQGPTRCEEFPPSTAFTAKSPFKQAFIANRGSRASAPFASNEDPHRVSCTEESDTRTVFARPSFISQFPAELPTAASSNRARDSSNTRASLTQQSVTAARESQTAETTMRSVKKITLGEYTQAHSDAGSRPQSCEGGNLPRPENRSSDAKSGTSSSSLRGLHRGLADSNTTSTSQIFGNSTQPQQAANFASNGSLQGYARKEPSSRKKR